MLRSTLRVAACRAAFLLVSFHANAATIDWGAPQNISGESDVSIAGSLVAAFDVCAVPQGVPLPILNGVPFMEFTVANANPVTMGNFTLQSSSNMNSNNFVFGSTEMPFQNLTAAYQRVLSSAVISGNSVPITLSISGLVVGAQYQFQWWANSSGGSGPTCTATAGNTVSLSSNVPQTDGGLGQFALGTFTADNSVQSIDFNGPDGLFVVNAFQLRQVPEPSSLWLVAIAGPALLGAWFFRRRAQSS